MADFLVQYAFHIVLGSAGVSLLYALFLILNIVRQERGNEQMIQISDAIQEGAVAFLNRQYTVVAVIGLTLAAVLALALGIPVAIGFVVGGAASAIAGIVGMHVSVRTNVRVAQAAQTGLPEALNLSFRGGLVTGLFVASLALASISLLLWWGITSLYFPETLKMLVGLGFGGSLISVFARLGGGIYTKAADVGTDMVGKIEAGIPEDDPRNPGVIADLVGDNVGDCAGMAADLFETYIVTLVAAILLAGLANRGNEAILFPLLVGATSLVATLIGAGFVTLPKNKSIMAALYKGLGVTVVIAAILLFPITQALVGAVLYVALIVGFLVAIGMVFTTEHFTGKNSRAVHELAQASTTGHGTNIIAGLALSLRSTFAPIILIGTAMLLAYQVGQLFGVALAAVAMLSLAGIVIAIDAFGPITDNAGGIAEMANLPEKARKATDALDAVGNTTKAVTKGYAIASAGLAALVLFSAYTEELGLGGTRLTFSLGDPSVLAGLFIGGALPYLFASLAMESVGKTATAIVEEIRSQFKRYKGIMRGTTKPKYARCVDIVTRSALRQMVAPALIPVLAPILIGLTLGSQALGGLLMGIIITGLFVALSMTTGGAAWDNAKKYIEDGHFGGKGSFAHQAAVTGDTVGDPYKDTAGPAINPMIKVANIVALLIAPLLA